MERRQIRFRGWVQGVGFRATTRSVASGFRVSGWVRNEPDGSVVAEVQGESVEVERFLSALRDRMRAHIANEIAAPRAAVEDEAGFHIQG